VQLNREIERGNYEAKTPNRSEGLEERITPVLFADGHPAQTANPGHPANPVARTIGNVRRWQPATAAGNGLTFGTRFGSFELFVKRTRILTP
jgi:hypothetical protein